MDLGAQSTSHQKIPEGATAVFTVSAASLAPIPDPLIVKVGEGLIFGTTIGAISWTAPYVPSSASLSHGDARYEVNLSMS